MFAASLALVETIASGDIIPSLGAAASAYMDRQSSAMGGALSQAAKNSSSAAGAGAGAGALAASGAAAGAGSGAVTSSVGASMSLLLAAAAAAATSGCVDGSTGISGMGGSDEGMALVSHATEVP